MSLATAQQESAQVAELRAALQAKEAEHAETVAARAGLQQALLEQQQAHAAAVNTAVRTALATTARFRGGA